MNQLAGKKLLVLGGKAIGSCDIVALAKRLGVYTIVTDYLPPEQSAAKGMADEAWDISTADVEALAQRAREARVDGVFTGVHEFNIGKMAAVCEKLGLPCYCDPRGRRFLENKAEFKMACREYGIPVSREYDLGVIDESTDLSGVEYPVIIKPVDGSGSRGFSICTCDEELRRAYPKAVESSNSGLVLVEQFMNYVDSAIIHYTIVNGEVLYSGISDKHSRKVFDTGAPIMSVQFFPSKYEADYLRTLDEKAKAMLKGCGLKNGPVWIEAFCDHGKFVFNELGYRFGGSMTNLPVQHMYGIDQLYLQLEYALTGKNEPFDMRRINKGDVYCILPVHVKPGTICRIEGLEELEEMPGFVQAVLVHRIGETIENWGSARQVFAYIHFFAPGEEDAQRRIAQIKRTIHIFGRNGEELFFNLY